MTPMKAIRAKCLECSNDSALEVKECPVTTCALYPFRLGKNPNRANTNQSEEAKQAAAERMRKYWDAKRAEQ